MSDGHWRQIDCRDDERSSTWIMEVPGGIVIKIVQGSPNLKQLNVAAVFVPGATVADFRAMQSGHTSAKKARREDT